MINSAPEKRSESTAVPGGALRALVAAVGTALSGSRTKALDAFAAAAAEACAADVAIVWLVAPDGDELHARAVHSVSASLAAELAGSRIAVGDDERSAQLDFAFSAPLTYEDETLGALAVLRNGAPFTETERLLAELAAGELALVLHALPAQVEGDEESSGRTLGLVGEGLAAGADGVGAPEHMARLAAEASGAEAVLLWRADGEEPRLAAVSGNSPAAESAALSAARVVLDSRNFLTRDRIGGASFVSVRLGEPAIGVLQLVFDEEPDDGALAGLTTFALRASEALRASDRAGEAERELGRTRALLEVVGQATAQLSVQHAVATAVEHAGVLLGSERVAVYLRDGKRLELESASNLVGPHEKVAERLLELVLGRYRGRGIVVVPDIAREPALADVRDAAAEAGIQAALALPLVAGGEAIGLLAAYPDQGAVVADHDETLMTALAAQLAIAVHNARLHERANMLAAARDRSLAAERETARRLRALYQISQSFAQSLSLEATLEALARSAVELLDVDAAVIRMPDARRELLTTRAHHVRDTRLEPAVRPVLVRPQAFDALAIQRLFRTRRPIVLKPQLANELGGSHRLLAPFLEKGATAAILPIATPGEVVATLTVISFDPLRPIVREGLQTALSIAAQAALAIDNGRLYQQQKEFADTMQRSLLPRSHPQLSGLEIGEVYESSARVDVGGDVYDFLELGDGRLAVVLGDVTGHGIEATADMAMAKFVFRSLAREHSSPGDFLASANDVVVGEIAAGKFITMVYLTIDAARGEVVAASAGHPAPLLVSSEGEVTQLAVRGLALGVDSGQEYDELRAHVESGGAIVVYTDGVVEARLKGELYGPERLMRVVSASYALGATEIAQAVITDCRAFAGELGDDCAVVVIKRTA